MHVNTCLDSSWTREVAIKQEKVSISSSSKISSTFNKENQSQRPISSFCIAVPPIKEDENDEEDFQTLELPGKGLDAFSVLMSGHKENAEWKVAEIDLKRDGKRSVGRRKAPFYKVSVGREGFYGISLIEC
jgi:hypothetical protein